MEQEFLMDINLLLIQIEQLNGRVHQLCETYRSRLADTSNTADDVLQLVLEEQITQSPKRQSARRHRWTTEDDELLVKMRSRGADYETIVQVLDCGLTKAAAKSRHNRLVL